VLLGAGCLTVAGARAAAAKAPHPLKVTLNQISPEGVGAAIGTVTVKQTKDGIELVTDLKDLAPGEHGFHLHENGSCDPADKEGKKVAGQAAGGHWDPDGTKAHKGPEGGGHKGDLPKLVVGADGKAKTKLPVKGLTLADVAGKTLMIHEAGDNYSDQPKPLGGGGPRVACGVVPAIEAAREAKGSEAKPAKTPAAKPAADEATKPKP
jgi:superoxide dismutase, Cu-Zn family